ncbi:hypothetical protein ABBQ32_000231 [Trebouxia sp. C0010 RCD-2024]
MVARGSLVLGAGAAASVVAGLVFRSKQTSPVQTLLEGNYRLLSKRDHQTVCALVRCGQAHVFRHWPAPGIRDQQKRNLLQRARAFAADSTSAAELEAARLEVLSPPVCQKRQHQLPGPSGTDDLREDPYYWLRDDDRKDEDVVAHLRAETDYCYNVLEDTEQLQEQLYREMRGRIQEADQSAPVRHGPFHYYSRTVEGKQYRVHCRRKLPPKAAAPSENDEMDSSQQEEILLDENAEAARFDFYMVGGLEPSPDHKLLAYAEDISGNEKYTLHVKDIHNDEEMLKEPIKDTAGNVAWANDNKTLFYVTKDKLDRPFKVWRHHVGANADEHKLVYHETDDQFYVHLGKSRDEKILTIHVGSAVTSETRFLSAYNPMGEWKVVLPRENGVEYDIKHRGDHFFVEIRDTDRPNSEILVAPVSNPTQTKVLIPHRTDVKIETMSSSRDYLVVFQRIKGLQEATIAELPPDLGMPHSLGKLEQIRFPEAAYSLGPGGQGDHDSPVLRLSYTSLTTPSSVIDVNMRTGKRAVKKVQPVLGGFDKDSYSTDRLWATAPDGTKVPMSIVYKKGVARRDGTDPLLLDGYGAYEICNDPYMNANRLSLIDRGFVFALAHVRGGGEMGRSWYEDGKYLNKKNTFTDFIACAEYLVKEKWTSPAHLCIEGRSAGGLTMGAVLNMRPDLFNAAIMGVPFVDVLTTMMDESIPLTNIEWEEWGNPTKPEYYDYMKSYSPVDNIKRAEYPNIMVTAGLHDPRVGYWEPAKFVAKLREHKSDNHMLLFKCDLGAGHFSQSGRFDRLKDTAVEFAFLLKCQGMVDSG